MASIFTFSNAVFVLALIFGSAVDAHAKPLSPFEIKGVAVAIPDGDTIAVRLDSTGETVQVRFADIDAPEVDHGQARPGQPFGIASRDFLRSKLTIYEEVLAKCYELDAHGRSVCRVYTSKGIDLSLAMVSAGYAYAYRRYLRDQVLLDVEALARKQRVGLWFDAAPIAPETWRKVCWSVADRRSNPWCDPTAEDNGKLQVPTPQSPAAKLSPGRIAQAVDNYQAAKEKFVEWIGLRLARLVNLLSFA